MLIDKKIQANNILETKLPIKYMSVLMEKKIKVNNILTINSVYANAIDDDARAKILQVLYKKQLSAEQIANHLKKSGHKKRLKTFFVESTIHFFFYI